MNKIYLKAVTFCAMLSLLAALILSGCEQAGAVSFPDDSMNFSASGTDTVDPAADTFSHESAADTVSGKCAEECEYARSRQNGGNVVFSSGGIDIPVPVEYMNLLDIDTFPENAELRPVALTEISVMRTSSDTPAWAVPGNPHAETLFTCREKSTYTPYSATEYNSGWLFSILRLDQIGFEQWMSSEGSGTNLFARDGQSRYYMTVYPADIRFDRTADTSGTWGELNEWADCVPWDILSRNASLSAYDPFDLYRLDYTYEGAHAAVAYTPYQPDEAPVTLILSQPVVHGEGGIWCVERIRYAYDGWTDTQLIYPASFGVDQSAAEYYAQLQANVAEHSGLLTPMGAVMDFIRHDVWAYPDAQEQDFVLLAHP